MLFVKEIHPLRLQADFPAEPITLCAGSETFLLLPSHAGCEQGPGTPGAGLCLWGGQTGMLGSSALGWTLRASVQVGGTQLGFRRPTGASESVRPQQLCEDICVILVGGTREEAGG